MGKIKYFEDLEVYSKSRELSKQIYSITREKPFARDYGLCDQIRRASVSVLSNIAEGFERGSRRDFIRFLYYSKASCGEIRAQCDIAFDQGYVKEEMYSTISDQCRQLSCMIASLIKYLKQFNSQY
jgi:four helix bundle protein